MAGFRFNPRSLLAISERMLVGLTAVHLLCVLANSVAGPPVLAASPAAGDAAPAGPSLISPLPTSTPAVPLQTPEPAADTPIGPTEVAESTPLPPSPTPTPSAPTPTPSPIADAEMQEERWIDVDLSGQLLTAYEGERPVRSVSVSTGLPETPTPAGQFRIWIKLLYDDMEGPGYFLPDVPYTMYFHEGYGLHAATWHDNFGQPMSHGCVNLPLADAKWLFDWASVGTLVSIHE